MSNRLANAVKAHAATAENGQIFISDLAEMMEIDLDLLKGALLKLHQSGEITLNRCDLPQAFGFDRVAQSEISYLSATFHRVVA